MINYVLGQNTSLINHFIVAQSLMWYSTFFLRTLGIWQIKLLNFIMKLIWNFLILCVSRFTSFKLSAFISHTNPYNLQLFLGCLKPIKFRLRLKLRFLRHHKKKLRHYYVHGDSLLVFENLVNDRDRKKVKQRQS